MRTTMPRPQMILSRNMEVLVAYLVKQPIGAIVTFEDAAKLVDASTPKHRVHALLHRAKELARRDHGVLYDNVRGVGYERMNPDAITLDARQRIRGIHRAGGRVIKVVDEVLSKNVISEAASKQVTPLVQIAAMTRNITSTRKIAAVAKCQNNKLQPVTPELIASFEKK